MPVTLTIILFIQEGDLSINLIKKLFYENSLLAGPKNKNPA
jgi:hypothetical protein